MAAPPITKSFTLLVEMTADIMPFAVPVGVEGSEELGSKGAPTLAPDTPTAIAVKEGLEAASVTVIVAFSSWLFAIAYHSSSENLSEPEFGVVVTTNALLWNE